MDDDDESVKLTFGTMPTRVTRGTTDETVVSITDDDDPQVTVSYENAMYNVGEGNSGAIKVVLNADPERTVTVPITKTKPGWGSQRRLIGNTGQSHLQLRGDRENHHLRGNPGHTG